MQDSVPTNPDVLPPAASVLPIDYSRVADELLQLYTRIELAAMSLPMWP